ncbi:MAG: hypothetical protein K2X66_17830, partial [Cyanobacteria bacterium]|nr:hypothetical protein [Cyanobacteriota bacterium]
DLMKLTSQVNNRVNQSPMQALHTLLLLYLPPMMFPQNVQISYEPPESEDKSNTDSTYHLTLFVETATLGRFKIDLGLHHSTQLIIAMEHDPMAQEILNRIESLFNQTLEKDGLPSTTIQFLLRPSRTDPPHSSAQLEASPEDSTSSASAQLPTGKANKEGKQSNSQKIAVFPTSGVSVIVVHSAFELAKIIFKLDSGKEAYTSV